jgi:hypothetical protein
MEVLGGGSLLREGFTNPVLTSDGGLPSRIHFGVTAQKNSNNKNGCLDRGSGLGKLLCVVCVVCGVCCVWCV